MGGADAERFAALAGNGIGTDTVVSKLTHVTFKQVPRQRHYFTLSRALDLPQVSRPPNKQAQRESVVLRTFQDVA